MNERSPICAVPVNDRAGLMAALRDALDGGAAVLPVATETPTAETRTTETRASETPPAAQGPGEDPLVVALSGLEVLPAGTALVIRTSGSSGRPKAVALAAAALHASAAATHERLGGPGQWLVALPTHLISGVQMLVRSIVAGTDPVYLGTATASFDPNAFFAAAERMTHDRRYVSLVPVQLTHLLDFIDVRSAQTQAPEQAREALENTLRRFDAILVGGQAVSLELRSRAYRMGLAMRRSYGMTETAGGCVYDGVEIGDTQVRIRQGEVQIAGPTLALGYVGDEALTTNHFFEADGARWYATGDTGELLGGMLTVTGRLDRVIVSGGTNVSLDEIERVAGEQPGWAGVVAVGIADAEWGERPVLVRSDDPAPSRAPFETVREAVRSALGVAAAPERELACDELPRLAGGKPDRAAITQLVRKDAAE